MKSNGGERMGKYFAAFRLSFAQTLMYRANFFFGRLRELVVFGALLYLFRALPAGAGGYDIAWAFVAAGVFLWIALRIWRAGLRHYASASA